MLKQQKVKADLQQAERVAWRIIKDWIEAQMAIIEAQLASMDEVFFPYMLDSAGQKTLYEAYCERQLLIGDGGSSYEA